MLASNALLLKESELSNVKEGVPCSEETRARDESLAAAMLSLHDRLVCLPHKTALYMALRTTACHITNAVQCRGCTMSPTQSCMLHSLQA